MKAHAKAAAANIYGFGPSPVVLYEDAQHIVEGRYRAGIAANAREISSALRLRHEVFNLEIAGKREDENESRLEFDAYDFRCRHLIVTDRESGRTVGTYRVNTLETAGSVEGFYSSKEFTLDSLPLDVLRQGIEIGRACVAKEHRNSKVLFLLLKALFALLRREKKRYFFGCCSIFTQDENVGRRAASQLRRDGYLHDRINVLPKHDGLAEASETSDAGIKLPSLFEMYLRIGARVCGPPMIDREFGTIDFFVIFDHSNLGRKYSKIFG